MMDLDTSHIPLRKIEPSFLAVRLKKLQSHKDPPFRAAFINNISNFICHELCNIPH